MSKNPETGRVKTVENFHSLILACTELSDPTLDNPYNPFPAELTISALSLARDKGYTLLDACRAAEIADDKAINTRADDYLDLKLLGQRVTRAFMITKASDKTKEDVDHFNKKLQGTPLHPENNSTEPTEPADADAAQVEITRKRSTSQQSYDLVTDHFSNLVEAASLEPTYLPNEADLKLTAIQAKLAYIRASNNEAKRTDAALTTARIRRDEHLYTNDTSLYELSKGVKDYIKTIYRPSSRQAKSVIGIRFVKPSDLKPKR